MINIRVLIILKHFGDLDFEYYIYIEKEKKKKEVVVNYGFKNFFFFLSYYVI